MVLNEIVVDLREVTSIVVVCPKCQAETTVELKTEPPPTSPSVCRSCNAKYKDAIWLGVRNLLYAWRDLPARSVRLRFKEPE